MDPVFRPQKWHLFPCWSDFGGSKTAQNGVHFGDNFGIKNVKILYWVKLPHRMSHLRVKNAKTRFFQRIGWGFQCRCTFFNSQPKGKTVKFVKKQCFCVRVFGRFLVKNWSKFRLNFTQKSLKKSTLPRQQKVAFIPLLIRFWGYKIDQKQVQNVVKTGLKFRVIFHLKC